MQPIGVEAHCGYAARVSATVSHSIRLLPNSAGRTFALADAHGRVATDMRVSLTDRCNLRCVYCMPAEGLKWLPRAEVLTDDEVIRLVGIGVEQLGITEVRLTGGEPLLRPGLVDIVAGLSRLRPRPELSMTTNGIGLDRLASRLADAGLDRVNVSLDSLDPEVFRQITRRDRLSDVLAGLAAADAAGLTPIKLNAVLLRGVNDHEASRLLDFCLERGYELRFIEQMPLDPAGQWSRTGMMTADEVFDLISADFELSPDPAHRGAAPAQTWLVNGGPARVGIIASVTRPFCGACNRVRLTADGQIRNCLFARVESDLRTPLRAGMSDSELVEAWQRAVRTKALGHGIDEPGFVAPDRPMSAIGG